MSSDHNRPPIVSGGPNFNAQFSNMNISAQPFVPNIQAQPFIPMGPPVHSNYSNFSYGSGGMYGPSHIGMGLQHMQPGSGGYGMPPQQQHGMGVAYNPHSISASTLESEYHPQSAQISSMPHHHIRGIRPHYQAQLHPHTMHQQQTQPHSTTLTPSDAKLFNQSEPTLQQDSNALDSWEDIADETTNPGEPELTGSKVSKGSLDKLDTNAEKNTAMEESQKEEPGAKLLEGAGTSTSLSSNGSTNGNGKKSPNTSRATKVDAASKLSQPQLPKTKDDKENLNVIFIGHVDAGKSTIGGHVMFLTGGIDKRTLDKYEREAKEKNRETWYLSWALDTNQEERDKGKTVEVGRAFFETSKKRFTILDAPGHAGFVPNMIGGAAQADVGVLVISARKGEFETGFERKGQTREHAMLAKTAGVKHLVVLINKMDDPTVKWLEERYEECKTKLTPFLKKVGFNPKTDIFYIPVSGLTGANLMEISAEKCPWYSGPPFITYLDNLPPVVREDNGIFRMPIADKYKDMGTLVMGKLESGAVMKGSSLLLMPNRTPVEVLQIVRVEEEVLVAYSGDNIKLRLKGVEEEDISPGFVLCDPSSPCNMSQTFEAQIAILEHKSIICAGYNAVLHIHTVVEEVQIIELKLLIDRKTGKKLSKNPRFVKQDQVVIATLQTAGIICVEKFKDFPQMARFTLRDEGKTIAIGKVLKLI